jgi:kynurenine/2-aminoadipate aminotransferase
MLGSGSRAVRACVTARPRCCHSCRRLSACAVDYEAYLSARSKRRRPSAIRALQPLLAEPGMISLGGGMPNKATFPFVSITVGLKGGESFQLVGDELEAVLQYSGTRGLSSLMPHLQAIQQAEHGTGVTPLPYEICVSTGSQDALSKAFDLFTSDGERETPLLVEEPTYSGSLAYLQPTGTRLVGVPCDSGIR